MFYSLRRYPVRYIQLKLTSDEMSLGLRVGFEMCRISIGKDEHRPMEISLPNSARHQAKIPVT